MKDKKLTDAEIVKALEELQNMTELTPPICNYEKDLTNPPYCKPFEQFQYNVRIALDLINRQNAENERLKAVNDSFTDIGKLYSEIKAEAYKECIERVKEESTKINACHNHVVVRTDYQISGEALDDLLKESVGEQLPSNDVKCKDCEYLEFELPYAVCSKAYKGIVAPDDSCGKGKTKELVGDNQ